MVHETESGKILRQNPANYTNENISFVSHAKRSGFRYWPGELAGLNRSRKVVELGPVPLPDATEMLPGRSIP